MCADGGRNDDQWQKNSYSFKPHLSVVYDILDGRAILDRSIGRKHFMFQSLEIEILPGGTDVLMIWWSLSVVI